MGVLDTLDKIMAPEDIKESEKHLEQEKKKILKKRKRIKKTMARQVEWLTSGFNSLKIFG